MGAGASLQQHRDEYARIDTEYTRVQTAREVRDVKNSLKLFRPPTAPSSDLEKERKAITADARRSLYFLQIALFLVVLVMLSYLILPLDYANPIAFLLLCVGISMGFFLKR
jgi:hypothetical protein